MCARQTHITKKKKTEGLAKLQYLFAADPMDFERWMTWLCETKIFFSVSLQSVRTISAEEKEKEGEKRKRGKKKS